MFLSHINVLLSLSLSLSLSLPLSLSPHSLSPPSLSKKKKKKEINEYILGEDFKKRITFPTTVPGSNHSWLYNDQHLPNNSIVNAVFRTSRMEDLVMVT